MSSSNGFRQKQHPFLVKGVKCRKICQEFFYFKDFVYICFMLKELSKELYFLNFVVMMDLVFITLVFIIEFIFFYGIGRIVSRVYDGEWDTNDEFSSFYYLFIGMVTTLLIMGLLYIVVLLFNYIV